MTGCYDSIAYDLGCTVIRQFIGEDMYPTASGGASNYSGWVTQWSALINELKARGITTFCPTVLSPPGWMKDNNSYANGGHLRAQYYSEFSHILVDMVKEFKRQTGLDMYAVSLQNELAFSEPYGSCIFTPNEWRDLIKVAGPLFSTEIPNTRLFGPECMGTMTGYGGGVQDYVPPVVADAGARPYLDVIAVHSYVNGVAPDYGSAPGWTDIATYSAGVGLPTWMTETSGIATGGDVWSNAMDFAKQLFLGLKYGHISLWSWLNIAGPTPYDDGFLSNGAPTNLYFGARHYYHFVRPGAHHVACTSNDANVLAIAFTQTTPAGLTVILINNGTAATSATLSGAGIPALYHVYQSSASARGVNGANVASGAALNLPASSITTLYSSADPVAVVPHEAARSTVAAAALGRQATRVYGLDGRLVGAEAGLSGRSLGRAAVGCAVIRDGLVSRVQVVNSVR
jgi:O-glycosyl hydrolase